MNRKLISLSVVLLLTACSRADKKVSEEVVIKKAETSQSSTHQKSSSSTPNSSTQTVSSNSKTAELSDRDKSLQALDTQEPADEEVASKAKTLLAHMVDTIHQKNDLSTSGLGVYLLNFSFVHDFQKNLVERGYTVDQGNIRVVKSHSEDVVQLWIPLILTGEKPRYFVANYNTFLEEFAFYNVFFTPTESERTEAE